MDNNILRDWALSLSESIHDIVKERYPEDLHRWPRRDGFESKGFVWKNQYLIVVLYYKDLQMQSVKLVEELPFDIPFITPSVDNIIQIHNYLYERLSVHQNDALLIVPITEGEWATGRFKNFSENDKQLWKIQITLNVERQFYYVKGFDVSGGFFLLPWFKHLSDNCGQFFKDNPKYTKNVFIMTKFDKENLILTEAISELRNTLQSHGYNPLRAEDKMYLSDRDMWNNACVYMLCCKQGIAILENHSKQEYNANVAIEYGFMKALNRQVLLLRDKRFPHDRADITGKETPPFDIECKETIKGPVEIWLKELT